MSRRQNPISRRQALARLGLGISAAYCAPALTGLSRAAASSSPSASSAASPASSPSPPDPASAPSAPSGASGGQPNSGPKPRARTGCSAPSGAERASISRRDMTRANAAVARGAALPLRQIVTTVQKRHPGRLIRVGFSESRARAVYWLQMVAGDGTVQTVTVDAASGGILGVEGC